MLLINEHGEDLCTYPYFSQSSPMSFFASAGGTPPGHLEGETPPRVSQQKGL